jgi:hypothetical protein
LPQALGGGVVAQFLHSRIDECVAFNPIWLWERADRLPEGYAALDAMRLLQGGKTREGHAADSRACIQHIAYAAAA